jgi:hypothetical protein
MLVGEITGAFIPAGAVVWVVKVCVSGALQPSALHETMLNVTDWPSGGTGYVRLKPTCEKI